MKMEASMDKSLGSSGMSEESQGTSCTNAEKPLQLHDYIGLSEVSSYSNPPMAIPCYPNSHLGEAELRLGLSLAASEWALGDNSGRVGPEENFAGALQNQARAMDDGVKCGYELVMATGRKRGFNQAFGNRGEEQVGKGILKLQMCGPSHPSGMEAQQYSSKPPQHSSLPYEQQSGVADSSSTSPKSTVVGWPPIRSYRKNTLAAQPISFEDGDEEEQWEGVIEAPASFVQIQGNSNSLFVKVNMEGVPIGRKIDLNTRNGYKSLALALEDMFHRPANFQENGFFGPLKTSWLVEDCSDYLLTYEDKEGDWMLVGDVPWRMFITTVKRLRIVKTSEGNGLGPKCSEKMNCRKTKAA